MKARYLFPLLFIFFNPVWADFSNTKVWHHPIYLTANEPYVIDLRGDWPTDCHPGEQKPVISEYTGDSVLIEFETIVEHVTCNEVATPYRVLVDMSDVIDTVEKEYDFIDITVRYDGYELEEQLTTFCGLWCDPPPPPRDIKPEAGLYHSDGLEKQGLLLARQGQRMAAYPLIYDESGSSEWVFGPGGIVENVFFSTLYELTGGQCLGCPPPDEPAQLNVVGKISMLMDSQGLVQVKINDGLFTTYEQTEFGYGSHDVGEEAPTRMLDLSGRWAFAEAILSGNSMPPVDPPECADPKAWPLVFDVALSTPEMPVTPLPERIFYSVLNMGGEEIAQMFCEYRENEMVCDVSNPEINQGDRMYEVKALSLERLSFTWAGPIIPEIGTSTMIFVRVD